MMKLDRQVAHMANFVVIGSNSLEITNRYGHKLSATISDDNRLNAIMPDGSEMSQVISERPIKLEERNNQVQTFFSETDNIFIVRVIEKLHSWSDWQGYINQ